MDVIFDWNLGNMIYHGLITLQLCGFPFAEIGVVSVSASLPAIEGQTAQSLGSDDAAA